MKPIEFPEQTTIFAEDQPEYNPLPVHISASGLVTSCWELDEQDIADLLATQKLWIQQLTFGQPLQPQLPLTYIPEHISELAEQITDEQRQLTQSVES